MSTPLIKPRLIKQAEFEAYTTNWYTLVTGDDANQLNKSFTVTDGKGNPALMNYAYLTAEIMGLLLYEINDSRPCVWVKFALVPKDNDPGTLLFSLVLYSNNINLDDNHPYYCLAGVREYPAQVVKDLSPASAPANPDKPVPTQTAAEWIMNWNNQVVGNLGFEMLGNSHERLLGYTFPLSDFLNAWPPQTTSEELWLNFDMHTRMFPTPDPAGALLFSTIIDTNDTPTGDNPGTIVIDDYYIAYFDISRPCPPYCDANWVEV